MTHAVEISSLDFFAGTMWCQDEGRGVRGWLAENVSTPWRLGDFAVEFQDETDAILFRLWYGECDDNRCSPPTC